MNFTSDSKQQITNIWKLKFAANVLKTGAASFKVEMDRESLCFDYRLTAETKEGKKMTTTGSINGAVYTNPRLVQNDGSCSSGELALTDAE